MRHLLSLALVFAIGICSIGCEHKATTSTKETIKGPGGTTEIEHKDTVKKSGENAPNP